MIKKKKEKSYKINILYGNVVYLSYHKYCKIFMKKKKKKKKVIK